MIVWEADATTFVFSYVNPEAKAVLGYPRLRDIVRVVPAENGTPARLRGVMVAL